MINNIDVLNIHILGKLFELQRASYQVGSGINWFFQSSTPIGPLVPIYLSKIVLLNNFTIKATVKWKIEKVGGKLGKKIFYNWDGRAH
jgi:hypothetical protein